MTTETQGAGLTEAKVREIHAYMSLRGTDVFYSRQTQAAANDVVALCDPWLSTRPSPQAGAIKLPVPEFTCDNNGQAQVEWCGGNAKVLTVTFDEDVPEIYFAAATGPGITCSGRWKLGDEPPQSFVDAYRSVALNNSGGCREEGE